MGLTSYEKNVFETFLKSGAFETLGLEAAAKSYYLTKNPEKQREILTKMMEDIGNLPLEKKLEASRALSVAQSTINSFRDFSATVEQPSAQARMEAYLEDKLGLGLNNRINQEELFAAIDELAALKEKLLVSLVFTMHPTIRESMDLRDATMVNTQYLQTFATNTVVKDVRSERLGLIPDEIRDEVMSHMSGFLKQVQKGEKTISSMEQITVAQENETEERIWQYIKPAAKDFLTNFDKAVDNVFSKHRARLGLDKAAAEKFSTLKFGEKVPFEFRTWGQGNDKDGRPEATVIQNYFFVRTHTNKDGDFIGPIGDMRQNARVIDESTSAFIQKAFQRSKKSLKSANPADAEALRSPVSGKLFHEFCNDFMESRRGAYSNFDDNSIFQQLTKEHKIEFLTEIVDQKFEVIPNALLKDGMNGLEALFEETQKYITQYRLESSIARALEDASRQDHNGEHFRGTEAIRMAAGLENELKIIKASTIDEEAENKYKAALQNLVTVSSNASALSEDLDKAHEKLDRALSHWKQNENFRKEIGELEGGVALLRKAANPNDIVPAEDLQEYAKKLSHSAPTSLDDVLKNTTWRVELNARLNTRGYAFTDSQRGVEPVDRSSPLHHYLNNVSVIRDGERKTIQKYDDVLPMLDAARSLYMIAESQRNEAGEKVRTISDRHQMANFSSEAHFFDMLFLMQQTGVVEIKDGKVTRADIKIQPLIETLEDMQAAPEMFRNLLSNPLAKSYYQQTGEITVMIGFSDGAASAGNLGSLGTVDRLIQQLQEISDEAGIKMRILRGYGPEEDRGGTRELGLAQLMMPYSYAKNVEYDATIQAHLPHQMAESTHKIQNDLASLVIGTFEAANPERQLPKERQDEVNRINDILIGFASDEFNARVRKDPAALEYVNEIPKNFMITSRPQKRGGKPNWDDTRAIGKEYAASDVGANMHNCALKLAFQRFIDEGVTFIDKSGEPLTGEKALSALYKESEAFRNIIDMQENRLSYVDPVASELLADKFGVGDFIRRVNEDTKGAERWIANIAEREPARASRPQDPNAQDIINIISKAMFGTLQKVNEEAYVADVGKTEVSAQTRDAIEFASNVMYLVGQSHQRAGTIVKQVNAASVA